MDGTGSHTDATLVGVGDLWIPVFRHPCRGAHCGTGNSGGLRRPANIRCTSGAGFGPAGQRPGTSQPAKSIDLPQRGTIVKPWVARDELPWDSNANSINPNGVASREVSNRGFHRTGALDGTGCHTDATLVGVGDLWFPVFRHPCRGAHCGTGNSGGLRRPANIRCTSGAGFGPAGQPLGTSQPAKSIDLPQRGTIVKPRVARNELPWDCNANSINPNGVASREVSNRGFHRTGAMDGTGSHTDATLVGVGDLWIPVFRHPCRGAHCGTGNSGGLRRPANIRCTSGAGFGPAGQRPGTSQPAKSIEIPQRGTIVKPRVARNELPWNSNAKIINPNGVASSEVTNTESRQAS